MMTNEGPQGIYEAIESLLNATPVPALEWRSGMAKACQDHVEDTGPQGLTGHTGTDGSSPYDRMNRYGSWGLSAAENISYGSNTGIDIVMQLFIDDGVASRGHRTNLMAETSTVTGNASGPHSQYGDMTCIGYAGSYVNAPDPDPISVVEPSVDPCGEIVVEFFNDDDAQSDLDPELF
jgi:hypothetical protein